MSWAGDVAQMLAGLLLREETLGETYSACTAEHRTWGEIADYYRDICGLEAIWVDQEEYLPIIANPARLQGARWQLEYDRLFDRGIIHGRCSMPWTPISAHIADPRVESAEDEPRSAPCGSSADRRTMGRPRHAGH